MQDLDSKAVEISEERYEDMLEVLPPIYFKKFEGEEVQGGFIVSEALSSAKNVQMFSLFFKYEGKFFESVGYIGNRIEGNRIRTASMHNEWQTFDEAFFVPALWEMRKLELETRNIPQPQ